MGRVVDSGRGYHRRVIRPRGLAGLCAILAVLVGACGGTASPSPLPTFPTISPSLSASPSLPPSPSPPSVTPSPSPPTPSQSASPTPTATPTPTASPPPTVTSFWSAVAEGIETAGRLRITVIGPAPGVLRYEPTRSATVVDGVVTFVCVDNQAYDGQSGFIALPGAWVCGIEALVQGFRTNGQPLDSWQADFPSAERIVETIAVGQDGRWQWTFQAHDPFVGGDVRTTVISIRPPARSSRRRGSDPVGSTTYGISYSATFPPIALP